MCAKARKTASSEPTAVGELVVDWRSSEIADVLGILLKDYSTDRARNIVWGCDGYADRGAGFGAGDPITPEKLAALGDELQLRALKGRDAQAKRTREQAEVFTPSRICAKMCAFCDYDWLSQYFPQSPSPPQAGGPAPSGRRSTTAASVIGARRRHSNVEFRMPENLDEIDASFETFSRYLDEATRARAKRKTPIWQEYLFSRRLEITCGEAPFIASRYDAATGERIPVGERVGFLDRKLAVIGNYVDDSNEWIEWSKRAFESVYGYEYQGDNLFIARLNLFLTFVEYFCDRWEDAPFPHGSRERVAETIARNFWQMDGLKSTIPFSGAQPTRKRRPKQMELFQKDPPKASTSFFDKDDEKDEEEKTEPKQLDKESKVTYWGRGGTKNRYAFNSITYKGQPKKSDKKKETPLKFDYIIGNPPYQEEIEDNGRAKPVYNLFMDASYDVGTRVLLITPGRFLSKTGFTPVCWDEKMLSDTHLKVLQFEPNSRQLFNSVDIKGGIVITFHNVTKNYGAIEVFFAFSELESIYNKVVCRKDFETLEDWIIAQNKWNLDVLYADYPEYRERINSEGRDRILRTSVFTQIPIFTDEAEIRDHFKIIGLINNKRVFKFIDSKYIDTSHRNLFKYKVLVPKANGSGALGEVLSAPLIGEPLIGEPLIGYTQSFIGIGDFDTYEEAEASYKYIKTKFARVLLGILKTTQDNSRSTWKYVPWQDFTSKSDIDWSVSVAEIDQQLYRKYGLSKEEIAFIESKVREMK